MREIVATVATASVTGDVPMQINKEFFKERKNWTDNLIYAYMFVSYLLSVKNM